MIAEETTKAPFQTHCAAKYAMQTEIPLSASPWNHIKDGHVGARAIYERHYSHRAYSDGRRPLLFVGPGEKMILMTPEGNALFAWRKFIDDSGQEGVNCAVFRNESAHRSSDLICEAEKEARKRWPLDRFYTYVNPEKVKSINPGYCFKRVGWHHCGETKRGLHVLEKLSDLESLL